MQLDFNIPLSGRRSKGDEDHPDRIAIEHEIDDCLLDTKIVFPLGIIVTELVTNALKYAFPDERTGMIRIRVKIQDEHRIIMTVTDNGIGITEERLEEEKRGFGLQLVYLLAQQISSDVTMRGNDGPTITLSVPIPESPLSGS
jgi:two-component sensor histidine kinase